MFFLKSPAPLWFLGGGNVATSVGLNVNLAYNLSASISNFDRDIELSAQAFNLSVSFTPLDVEQEAVAIQANINLDDISYSTLDLRASVVPVFLLDQTGAASKDVNAAYNLSASVAATIFPNVVPQVAYGLSASLSAALLIADNTDVTLAYNMSATFGVILQVQTGTLTKDVVAAYGMSANLNVDVSRLTAGGLVWSEKKQKYIAVRVGL